MLRDYQVDSFNKLREKMTSVLRKVILAMPTGSGKSIVAIEIIKRALAKGSRVAFCVDRIILADQFAQMCYNAGVTDFSIMQADNQLYKPYCKFQIMTAQTLARRNVEQFPLVVVDESHIVYKILVKKMIDWDKTYWIGLTATPYTKGLGKLWQGLVTGITMEALIKREVLSDYDAYGPKKYAFDIEGIPIVGGEFNQEKLGERAAQTKIQRVGDILEHWFRLGKDQKTIVRCVDVADAEYVAERFKENGVDADCIHCYLGQDIVREKLNRFKNDGTVVLTSVNMISRGFDMPECKVLIDAKPVKSTNDFIQVWGRVLRGLPGKRATILDHAGNGYEHGMPHWYEPTRLDEGKRGEAKPYKKKKISPKECPNCGKLLEKELGVYRCQKCNIELKSQSKVETIDGELELMDKERKERLKKATPESKNKLYSKLLAGARAVGWKDGWAYYKYKEYFGVGPAHKAEMDGDFYEFLRRQDKGKAVRIIHSLINK